MIMPRLVFILVFQALTSLQITVSSRFDQNVFTTVYLYIKQSITKEPCCLFLKAGEKCQISDVSELKEEIRKLNNKLLIGEWKVMHLRTHRRFRLVPNQELSLEYNKTSENNTEPSPTLPSIGGSLLVHDKGNVYTLIRHFCTCILFKPFHKFMRTDCEQIVKLITYKNYICLGSHVCYLHLYILIIILSCISCILTGVKLAYKWNRKVHAFFVING